MSGIYITAIILAVVIFLFFAIRRTLSLSIDSEFETLIQNGELDNVQKLFSHLVATDTTFLTNSALWFTASLDISLLNYPYSNETMLEFFDKMAKIAIKEQPDSAHAQIFMAGLLEQHKKYEQCRLLLNQTVAKHPKKWFIVDHAAKITMRFDPQNAEKMFETIYNLLPKKRRYYNRRCIALMSRANCLDRSGDLPGSIKIYTELLQEKKFVSDLSFLLVPLKLYFNYTRLGENLKAMLMLTKVTTEHKFLTRYFLPIISSCMCKAGCFNSMEYYINEATTLNVPQTIIDIAQIKLDIALVRKELRVIDEGNRKRIYAKLKEIGFSNENSPYVLTSCADLFMSMGEKTYARLFLEKAIKADLSNIKETSLTQYEDHLNLLHSIDIPNPHLALADIYIETQDYDEAENTLKAGLKDTPVSEQKHFQIKLLEVWKKMEDHGQLSLSNKNNAQKIQMALEEELNYLLSLAPGNSQSLEGLADISFLKEDYHASSVFCRKLTELEPGVSSYWFKRGKVCLYLDDFELAEKCFDNALIFAEREDLQEKITNLRAKFGLKPISLPKQTDDIIELSLKKIIDNINNIKNKETPIE